MKETERELNTWGHSLAPRGQLTKLLVVYYIVSGGCEAHPNFPPNLPMSPGKAGVGLVWGSREDRKLQRMKLQAEVGVSVLRIPNGAQGDQT